MKKYIILVMFFTTILFADEIENPKSNLRVGTQLKFENGYLQFYFGNVCSKNFINCINSDASTDSTVNFTGFAYYSTVDTNYVVFVDINNSDIIMHRVSLRNQSLNDIAVETILRQEFLNLQEWKVFELSKDSAEHLIDRMIEIMSCGSFDIYGVFYTHGTYCDTIKGCCKESADGGAVMVPNWWTLLPDEKPTSVSKTPIKNRFSLSRLNRETFFVEGINDATPYKVFDVNGILLKQGFVQNGVVQVPKTPSILDIAHQKFLLK